MDTTGNTYSSAHLRERDKILEEKHRKQFALVERKLDRLRRSNDDTLKQLFDVRVRGDKLARSLGFNDIHEAQVAIDTADHESPLTFKECFVRLDALQSERTRESAQHEKLREYLRLVEQERDHHKANAAAADRERDDLRNTIRKQKEMSVGLSQEMAQLKARYDSLSEVKERAAERYKTDYHKWRKFKNWIFTDEEEYAKGKDGQELSVTEKKRRRNKGIMKKKKLIKELGPDYTEDHPEADANRSPSGLYPPPMGGTSPLREHWDSENNKDNEATPIPERRRTIDPPRSSQLTPLSPTIVASTIISPLSSSNAATRLVSTPLLKSLANVLPSASPPTSLPRTLTKSSRMPLTFQPIFLSTSQGGSQVKIKQEPGSSPPVPVPDLVPASRPMKRLRTVHAPSSDTEDDSQAIDLFPAATPVFKVPAPPTILKSLGLVTPEPSVAMDGSQTEDESQSLMFPLPSMVTTKQPARPHAPYTFAQREKEKDRRRSDPIVMSVSRNADGDTMPPPRKIQRLSGDDMRSNTTVLLKSFAATVQERERDDGDNKKWRTPTPMSSKKVLKDKEKEKENISSDRSMESSGSRHGPQDYSAFKGRGRYAKDLESSDKTINAEYVIDPAQNGGLEFRYDEVVRTKEDRRRMDAGDCECCRDYYTAIGPLPTRLQAPLWRSPPTSPVKFKASCPRHDGVGDSSSATHLAEEPQMDSEVQAAITSHKQAISRHRHHWERPRTPPGYWNIGFPDTQEAADINERAREMHRRKREEVQSEVQRGGGKYKRRQGV